MVEPGDNPQTSVCAEDVNFSKIIFHAFVLYLTLFKNLLCARPCAKELYTGAFFVFITIL
jgi:hypothetical protein